MYLILCGLLSIACHIYSADPVAVKEYAEVYNKFRQTLKQICLPSSDQQLSENEKNAQFIAVSQAYNWLKRTKDGETDTNFWKITKLPTHDAYLIAEYAPHAILQVTPQDHAVLRWPFVEGWAVAVISETNNDFALPNYTECANLLNLQATVGMHAIAQAFLLEKQWGGVPSFAGKAGGFWWKIHGTFPPCPLSLELFDPKNPADQKYPNRILHTIYDYAGAWEKYQLSKTCKTLYAHRLSHQQSDETLQQLKACFIQPENMQDPRISPITRYFFNKHGNVLKFIYTRTVANPGAFENHIEVDGYHVVAYARDKKNVLLPPSEICKMITGIDTLYLSPAVAQVHICSWQSDFFYEKLKWRASGFTDGFYWETYT